MIIDLIAVGRRMPDWIESAFNEYRKRLPPQLQLNLIEIAAANRTRKNSTTNFKKEEEARILSAIKPGHIVIVLDETGRQLSSQSLAAKLDKWMSDQQPVSMIIGGPDGVSESIKQKADVLWSLSKMTLPHGLVRVMLAEQLYRGWTILSNHPYHRE